ncbi:restriction endonuclease subunit S [Bacillus pseudomycoides]|uniref:restriction endonuclease subunit S n=1 Tax=Bacillus pseudomycoides TaxID=64104 RepID=UPI000BFAA7FF|nr:restriction endonuclease subunit S [Bacillus pseudomycoides]MBD5800428.1 restriction endonuclease subunit S [Bacillus pseudomycoides]MED1477042.1 restriction endonuclease subunit S [Bacillus pseudomycoides]PEO79065.1 restriction endonuclease subunit S [Bacillus pseudomycoides]
MKNKRTPDIRFAGFTGDWEHRKLGDVADIVGGGTPSTSSEEYWNGNIDWYSPVEIGEKTYVSSSQKKITELGLKKSSAKILPVGTILFTSRAGIGSTAILAKEGATNQGFQSIVPHKEMLDSYFIYSRSHELKRYGELTGAGSTFVEVSGKQMAKMPILMPTLEEQRIIGKLFENMDNLITLHQQELTTLKQTKKGFLQKMFPKEGESVPEVRFPGLTGDWEQRKLESIYEKIRNAFVGTATPYYVEDGHFYLESNNVKDGQINRNTEVFINDEFYEKQKNNWLHTGDLVMVQSGHVGHTAVIPEELDNTAAHALIMFSNYREKTDPYFLNYQFQTHKSKKKLNNITTGNTIKHILASEMKKFLVDIPKYEEQKMIGKFFKQLDDAIALHQRELDALKETKKAFLQKMFA